MLFRSGAYSDRSPLRAILRVEQEGEVAVCSTEPRCLIFHTALLTPKTTRSTQGVAVMTLKPRYRLDTVRPLEESAVADPRRYRVRSLPATGALLRQEDTGETQIALE